MSSTNLTTQYLALAEQLLDAAGERPTERPRLVNAAQAAKRLASLALYPDAVATGYLPRAADLLSRALIGHIEASVVTSANVYADMADVVIRQAIAERRAANQHEGEAVSV